MRVEASPNSCVAGVSALLSSAAVEGLNKKIGVVTGRSYGFRTYEAMELALYQERMLSRHASENQGAHSPE